MDNLEFRINLAIAKGRNIIYYRERDTRERCQYIHVVREFIKTLVDLVNLIPENDPGRNFFIELIKVINPKVKSEECIQTILEMKNIYEGAGIRII